MNYSIEVECENCGWSGSLETPEGLRISEMPCPECRTKSLVLVEKKGPEQPKKESTE